MPASLLFHALQKFTWKRKCSKKDKNSITQNLKMFRMLAYTCFEIPEHTTDL
jgi:hypothetical protein